MVILIFCRRIKAKEISSFPMSPVYVDFTINYF